MFKITTPSTCYSSKKNAGRNNNNVIENIFSVRKKSVVAAVVNGRKEKRQKLKGFLRENYRFLDIFMSHVDRPHANFLIHVDTKPVQKIDGAISF